MCPQLIGLLISGGTDFVTALPLSSKFDPMYRPFGSDAPQYCRTVNVCPVSAAAPDGVAGGTGHCRVFDQAASAAAQTAASVCTRTAGCDPEMECPACANVCAESAPADSSVGYE